MLPVDEPTETMFLPSSSMKVQPTEDDAEKCYLFANNENKTKFCGISFGIGVGIGHSFEEGVRRHYENFRIEGVSSGYTIIALFAFINYLAALHSSFYYYDGIWCMRILLIARTFVSAVGLYTSYKIFNAKVKPGHASGGHFGKYVSTVTNLSNFVIIGAALVNGGSYAWKSSLGSCFFHIDGTEDAHKDYYFFDCNPAYELGSTATDAYMVMLLGNIFLVASLRCHSYWAAWVNYMITLISVIIATAVSQNPWTSIPVIF